jgi:hypothetical protein
MPTRSITVDGRSWRVFPSGFLTANHLDEFGVLFVSGEGADRVVRVSRYSPVGTRSREQSLLELSEADLADLLRQSQPSETAPETGYRTTSLPGAP